MGKVLQHCHPLQPLVLTPQLFSAGFGISSNGKTSRRPNVAHDSGTPTDYVTSAEVYEPCKHEVECVEQQRRDAEEQPLEDKTEPEEIVSEERGRTSGLGI